MSKLPIDLKPEQVLNNNVGVLGHVDSGKTSLVKALSTLLSTASLDRNPQSIARGITLDLGFSAFLLPMPPRLKKLALAHISPPVSASFGSTSGSSSAQGDGGGGGGGSVGLSQPIENESGSPADDTRRRLATQIQEARAVINKFQKEVIAAKMKAKENCDVEKDQIEAMKKEVWERTRLVVTLLTQTIRAVHDRP
jgi:hypothetical protein